MDWKILIRKTTDSIYLRLTASMLVIASFFWGAPVYENFQVIFFQILISQRLNISIQNLFMP